MFDSIEKKPERPWPNPYLEVAAIVGHTTTTTSRIWFRTGQPGSFCVLIFIDSQAAERNVLRPLKQEGVCLSDLPPAVEIDQLTEANFAILDFSSSKETDNTSVVDLVGLTPITRYKYILWSHDENRPILGHQRSIGFRTLPDELMPTSFAFFSCHMPYQTTLFGRTKQVNEEMWDYLKEMLTRHNDKSLRFIIAGGDQVYADGVKTLDIWKYLNKVMRRENNQLLPDDKSMVTMYRDIYRGYWGIPALREVFSHFPSYMIWDDHEIGDGWGSFRFSKNKPKRDELHKLLPDLSEKDLSYTDGIELLERMFKAASQVYREYQHCHNPDMTKATPEYPANSYDYHFAFPAGAVYVLDGRGYRDFNRKSDKILGSEQHERFNTWIDTQDPKDTPFLFITSAVPMLHLSHLVVDQGEGIIANAAKITDDLRDSWEHKAHLKENRKMLKALFRAAKKGHRVCILSGDVHVAAVFRIVDPDSGCQIYQLTSSAITYNLPRPLGWALGAAVPDDGVTRDGYEFKRLARYTDSNFSLVAVDPIKDTVDFQLYGEQITKNPIDGETKPNSHSIAKIELTF